MIFLWGFFMVMPKIFPVSCHTKYIGTGSTFVAIKGHKQDGVDFISLALERGAKKIVIQKDVALCADLQKKINVAGATVRRVEDARLALAQLSANAHGNPAKKLKILGVTGTKGKTSTVFMLEHLLRSTGHKTALLSTVHNKIGTTIFPAELTTAQPDYLHSFFALCVRHGVEYVVLEAAAQAFSLYRVYGILFDGGVFTNFGQEHAEFYETQKHYFAAKCQLFKQVKSGAPMFVNADDSKGQHILQIYPEFFSFSLLQENTTVKARPIELIKSLFCNVCTKKESATVCCPALFGTFNAYNMLGALSLVHALGISLEKSAQAMKNFRAVPGRLERYMLPNGALCFIDYAHNPSSFQVVLSTLRKMTDQLIVLFGAGGNRDKTKRPQMGAIAAKYADHIIVTTDNPRTEDPQDISTDILAGISEKDRGKTVCELDREKAIHLAYKLSKKNGIVALLSKGRDEYQIFGNNKVFFSEREILQAL